MPTFSRCLLPFRLLIFTAAAILLPVAGLGAPYLVRDINPVPGQGSGNGPGSAPDWLTTINGTVYFTACEQEQDDRDCELWKTDGSTDGTVRVADVLPGPAGSFPSELTAVGSTLFFRIERDFLPELWKSDGTSAGTVRVAVGQRYNNLIGVDGTLFFTSGNQLWKSDGTSDGTVPLATFPSDELDSFRWNLTALEGVLFFARCARSTGCELWRSDGSVPGTYHVKTITPSFVRPEWTLRNFLGADSQLFFTACQYQRCNDGDICVSACELWKSDGTPDGTARLFPGDGLQPYSELPFAAFGRASDRLVFGACTAASGCELWASDGTPSGTGQIADINPGPGHSYPVSFVTVGGQAYFVAQTADAPQTWKTWKTDGTAEGTSEVFPGVSNDLLSFFDRLFFVAYDDGSGFPPAQLWTIDETAMPVPLTEFEESEGVLRWARMAGANGRIFFAANDGLHGPELWALSLDDDGPVTTTTTTTSSTSTSITLCTAGSCKDGDPCTEDRCEATGCVTEPVVDVPVCRLRAMLDAVVCAERRRARLRNYLERAIALLDTSSGPPTAAETRRAEARLRAFRRLVAHLQRRGAVEPECGALLRPTQPLPSPR